MAGGRMVRALGTTHPIRKSSRSAPAASAKNTAAAERPVAIDLFAGAGGLSLGVEQAGFDVVAAVEFDPIHAAIHRLNFPTDGSAVRECGGRHWERVAPSGRNWPSHHRFVGWRPALPRVQPDGASGA